MLDAIEALVTTESFTSDISSTAHCTDMVASMGEQMLGAQPERISTDGRDHLRWQFGESTKILLLGHIDTVWPVGTLARWPFTVREGRASGPGVFDMKAGVVQGLFALAELSEIDGVAFVLNSDEEIGSPTSRALIEESARGAEAVLVLEPSVAGALKHSRKGISRYDLHIQGVAAHVGLDPEKGANALAELARQVIAVEQLSDPELGTTVIPTVASAGSAVNVVPASAHLSLDVRCAAPNEQMRVHTALEEMGAVLAGVHVTLQGGPSRPVFAESASVRLLARAREVARGLGLPQLEAMQVGGGSDGNFTAALGIQTLDGLGAVGDGAHAEHEHIVIDAIPERAALVAALCEDVLQGPGLERRASS